MQLMRADALLAGSHQVNGRKPFVQGDVERANTVPVRTAELVPAIVAQLGDISGLRLASHLMDVERAAGGNEGSSPPAVRFHVS